MAQLLLHSFFTDLDNSADNEELKFSVLKRLPEVMLTSPGFYLMLFNKYIPVLHLISPVHHRATQTDETNKHSHSLSLMHDTGQHLLTNQF